MTPSPRHRKRPARGSRAAAAAALLLLLAGPPTLLTALVGNPLRPPAALHSVHLLTAPVDDATVLWLLGGVAWLLWLHLLGCLLVESLRQLRGTPVRMPLPGLLFGANTLLASHLIAALLLPPQPLGAAGMLTPATPRISAAASVTHAHDRHPDRQVAAPQHMGSVAARHAAAARDTSAVSAGIECRVLPPNGRHHDTLWDIASRHLGDGTRWREIYALNAGRRMPDGQHLTHASLIRPGWILRLPADAMVLDLDRVPTIPPLEPPTRATPGTQQRAARHEDPEQFTAAPEPPPSHQKRAAAEDAPDQRAVVTLPDSADGTAEGSSVPTPQSTAPITDTTGSATPADPTRTGSSVEPLKVVASLGALGVAAMGLLSALTRRRKIAARRRPLGVRHARPAPELLETEAQLRGEARHAEATATTIRLTLQLATRLCTEPQVLAVWQHPDGSIELVLAEPDAQAPAPAPFETTERGWLLPVRAQRFLYPLHRRGQETQRPADLERHTTDAGDPFPLLLPVGEQDGSACLVNLEPLGLISLLPTPGQEAAEYDAGHGPEGAAALVMAAWTQALAGAPWAEQIQLYLPAGWEHVATGLDRVRCVDPHDSDRFDAPAPLDPADRATLSECPTLAAARRTGAGCAELLRPQLTVGFRSVALPDWLPAAALDPLDPNTLLVAGPHPDAHTWQLGADGTLSIPGIADRLQPLRLDPAQHEQVLRLLEHAEDPPHAQPRQPEAVASAVPASSGAADEPPQGAGASWATTSEDAEPAGRDDVHEPHATLPESTPVAAPPPATAREPDPQAAEAQPLAPGPVEVAILGPVQIHGAAEPRPRQQSIEMLIYLGLHRQPITLQTLSAAIWPDRPYVERTVRNRLSDLRPYIHRRLDKLPGGRYQLTDLVVTDWQRFQNLADGNPTQQLAALALVRGAPFHGLGLDWYHLDGQLAEIEAAIVDLAVEVGTRALKHGDPDVARTAAVAGLRGCPYDERLYRIAMQSAAARGATGELHQLRRQLAYVLDDELEPDDSIQPSTELLYTELRARPSSPRP